MKGFIALTAVAVATPACAQAPIAASMPQAIVARKADVGSTLPSNTEVWLSLNGTLDSRAVKVGDHFDLTVSRDIMMGDYIVIPRGTAGHGQVTYRTGKGAFGKSAKFEFDLVDVKVGDRFIPISGHYRLEGQGNTGAAVGAVVAVGVFGAFVTGHSATAAQGSEWKAYTKEPLLVAIAPPPQAASVVAPAATTGSVTATSASGAPAAVLTPAVITKTSN